LVTSASLLSRDLCAFLEERVDSLESMRALLLLRDRPRDDLTALDVARMLGISQVATTVALDSLVVSELATSEPACEPRRYRLAALPPPSSRLLEELAHAYWNARVELLAEVAHHSVKRVREQAHRLFREALRHRGSEAFEG
jgi:DNA-binding MarR family transcriptional regulator